MAKDKVEFFFDHQEILEDLIRKRGIHEGLWKIGFEIGLVGTNVNVLNQGNTKLTPAGVVLITRIGLQRVTEPSELTADAAEVNPRESPPSRKRRKKRQK